MAQILHPNRSYLYNIKQLFQLHRHPKITIDIQSQTKILGGHKKERTESDEKKPLL